MPSHLFRCWPEVAARIRSAGTVRLFLDFDGTLASLHATPGDATLSESTRRALKRLTRRGQVHTAIVSGRRRGDLLRLVDVPRLQYWGLYGSERRQDYSLPPDVRMVLARARGWMTSLVEDLAPVWVEDKEFAFCVHFRGAPADTTRRARSCLRRVLSRYDQDLHFVPGAKVWNVLPRQVPGKGAALHQAIARLRTPFLGIYIGDDGTDESAFLTLKRGLTVRVGPARRTHARYRLSDPDEVRGFIERLDLEMRVASGRPTTGLETDATAPHSARSTCEISMRS